MEGSGTFEQFEFFASALDQHWVEVDWLLRLEVQQRQARLLEAWFAGDFAGEWTELAG